MECSAPSEKAPERTSSFSKQGRRCGDYRGIDVISQETKAVRIERMNPLSNALLLRRKHFIELREEMVALLASWLFMASGPARSAVLRRCGPAGHQAPWNSSPFIQ
jgi:hypothetical protein